MFEQLNPVIIACSAFSARQQAGSVKIRALPLRAVCVLATHKLSKTVTLYLRSKEELSHLMYCRKSHLGGVDAAVRSASP